MLESADDASLIDSFQKTGSKPAFEVVFGRNKDSLYRFLLQLSGVEAIAQDISQYAWLKVLELAREGQYRSERGATFRTFLFTLARNRYFDEYHRRHGAVRSESLDDYIERAGDPAAEEEWDPSAIVNDAQVRATIRSALAQLPAEQFEVVSLWMQGFALTEVAQITGAPWHTVVSRKTYALRKLKASLGRGQV
jgi:RNA polymerase sigma factor (sigma-70 family)